MLRTGSRAARFQNQHNEIPGERFENVPNLSTLVDARARIFDGRTTPVCTNKGRRGESMEGGGRGADPRALMSNLTTTLGKKVAIQQR